MGKLSRKIDSLAEEKGFELSVPPRGRRFQNGTLRQFRAASCHETGPLHPRGTSGSNPLRSTGESANFCFLSGGAPSATPRWHRVTAAPGRKVYGRGQFVTFTPEELNALDVESSKVIDLEKFVPRGDLDPVYFDSSYYLYPDCIASNQGARRAPRAVSRVARSCSTRR